LPDHPVENVSWDDINEFNEALNILSNSEDEKVQKLLGKVILGHQKGNHYDLPTEAQWEFVVKDRGQATDEYFDRQDTNKLADYAWLRENSDGHTHAVATRKPRIIDGMPFFDLIGNVEEWVKDYHSGNLLQPGIDPQGPSAGVYRVLKGSGYYKFLDASPSHSSTQDFPAKRDGRNGFRLIMTRE
jgi:formylglycine-generating enzyme required for sulfatase activity